MPSTSTITTQGEAAEKQSWAPVVTLLSIVALAYALFIGAILVQLV
jgi:hypothetical protein